MSDYLSKVQLGDALLAKPKQGSFSEDGLDFGPMLAGNLSQNESGSATESLGAMFSKETDVKILPLVGRPPVSTLSVGSTDGISSALKGIHALSDDQAIPVLFGAIQLAMGAIKVKE